ncbi:GTP cyclohydrolase II [Trichoderma gamsii]|uniref:GTP cyclohydrolase II n=1 Tax=Trichoderma gamsii TaxID=398673 RepID=A0A2P4ZIU6_9HYPO|nr:GTP cyclohydrolase II [Trichoderma gamsii]PON24193.1 GTP cyclohydrolase II [Trichoderma gamsii]
MPSALPTQLVRPTHPIISKMPSNATSGAGDSAQLPSFYSPRTAAADTPQSRDGQPIDELSLPPSHASASSASLPPPPSLLSPAFTPPATPGNQTPTTAGLRGIPVDSSIPSGGCGSKKPRLLETLPEVNCVVRARIPTVNGTEMFLHLYTNNVDNKEHLAIVFGNDIRSKSLDEPREGETEMDRMIRGAYTGRLFPGRTTSGMGTPSSESQQEQNQPQNPPLVRIHSECYTGETAWSARCDCGEQLDEAARLMALPGNKAGGIIIYLRQEGRGIGLGEKLKAYNLQDLGSDTVEANLLLRHPADARSYGLATAMLMDLGQTNVRLLTNNPDKVRAVEGPNREVVVKERVAMVPLSWKGKGGFRSQEVEGYLKTKIYLTSCDLANPASRVSCFCLRCKHSRFSIHAPQSAILDSLSAQRQPTGHAAAPVESLKMQAQDIRLRLVIRRHGLPEIKLLWPCSCAEDVTIAKVLEQVNEVVPLESGEWGLEDYAVELEDGKGGSFECLHFQQVGRILKDEDQVIIRSLLTGDLKRRRLSGRHQISDDGRHLIDGLAFGRSWLRTPRDRPHIDLPPRKRVRFSNEDEDEHEEQEQLLLDTLPSSRYGIPNNVRNIFDDDSDEDDDEDEAYQEYPNLNEHLEDSDVDDDDEEEDDDEDLEEELRFLRQDDAPVSGGRLPRDLRNIGRCLDPLGKVKLDTDTVSEDGQDGGDDFSNNAIAAHGYAGVPIDMLVAVFRLAFSELSDEDIRFALARTNKDMRKTYLSLTILQNPSQDFDRMMDDASFILAHESLQQAKETTSVINGLDANRLRIESGVKKGPLKPLIQEVEDSEEIEDSEFLRESQLNGGVTISLPTSNQNQDLSSDDTSESDFEESESNSEEDTSSEEESESGSEDDSSDASGNSSSSGEKEDRGRASTLPTANTAPKKANDASSEESSPIVDMTGKATLRAGNSKGRSRDARASASSSSESSNDTSDSDSTEESDSESESESESGSESESESESEVEEISSKRPVKPAPPTHRIQDVTAAPATQAQVTDTPPSAGLTRTQKRNARRKRNKVFKESGLEQSRLTNGDKDGAAQDDFLARKEALLAAILNESPKDGAKIGEAEMEDAPRLIQVLEDQPHATEIKINKATEAETSKPKDTPKKRSARVDVGAGRRLLFGALGLKAPTTKADEQKIRDSLMKDVRPLVNPRALHNGDDGKASENPVGDEDPEAWREKIIYKAVECCHEDMVLSEPPFPFVQRWDPQQKYQTMRKRKRASENYQADTSYDDSAFYYNAHEPEQDYYDGDAGETSKKKKRKSANRQNDTLDQDEQDVTLNYDEPPVKSSQFTDLDDLPSLPQDIKALPLLTPESAQPGMVITWNQLLMSKATKWQPELLPITGIIIPGGEDGSIHVKLARRDRENNEKIYDEFTGKRIYDKFEAPDLDEASGEDGEEEEDDGFRSLQWTEMLEPRILQQAPVNGNAEAAATEGEMPSGHDQVSELQPEVDALEGQPSTDQVRAAVENDLMHDSFGTIQSGQPLPRLDASMSEVQISTASNSFEFVGHLNSNNIANPPGAQLGHALTAAANPSNRHSAKSNCLVEREDEAAADQEEELAHSLANAVAEGTSNSHTPIPKMTEPSEDQGGEEEGEQAGGGEEGQQGEEQTAGQSGSAIHSDTVIAASQFDIPSGRQPRTAFSLEDGLPHGTLIPETLLHLPESTAQPNDSKSQASSSSRSSPFPSLEEIFMSAQPTQNSDRKLNISSFSASQVAVPTQDMEYEEAMRKLDEGNESDHSPEQKQEEQDTVDSKVFPNATQPSVRTRVANEELPALSTSLSQPAKKMDDQAPFAIPDGSQVIVLSSSPSSSAGVPTNESREPEVERPSPTKAKRKLPTGPGWVKKGTRDERDALSSPRRTVGLSLRASRRGRSEAEAPLVSAVNKYKGRKGR